MSEDTGSRAPKVPSWDGSADTFQSYCESALLYEQTTKFQDRYLAGPRLVGELQGAARRLVVGQRPDWVSFNGGVEHLLQHLRKCLGKPQVPELTELLSKYFKNSKRRQGELMGDYITRKCELYVRAQQAMLRVRPHHDRTSSRSPVDWAGNWHSQSRRTSVDSRASTDGGSENPIGEETQPAAPTASEAPSSNEGATTGQGSNWDQWGWQGYTSYWRGYSQYNWKWQSSDWQSTGSYVSQESQNLPELVPEFVQAWLLLQDAGLESQERNTVIVATQGDMTLQRVAQELRNQFADVDLKKRDTTRKYHGYAGEHLEVSDGEQSAPETAFNAEDELTAEGLALWSETEDEIQSALAAVQQAKRTLKNARERQKLAKQSRQYFRYSSSSRKADDRSREEKLTCLRCGKAGHKAAQCPASAPQSASSAEMAPFVCFAQDHSQEEMAWHAVTAARKVTTQEAMASGKAVIDCGATKSLGSVRALENLMQLSSHGVCQVDTQDRPVFGFGNSSEDRCVSTLHLKIQAGEKPGVMKIHALDRGSGPVLLSVATLKALGAILDFSDGTMVLRKVSDSRLLTLEESSTGHLLLPLTGDLLEGADQTAVPIPSLRSFLEQPRTSVRFDGVGDSVEPISESRVPCTNLLQTE